MPLDGVVSAARDLMGSSLADLSLMLSQTKIPVKWFPTCWRLKHFQNKCVTNSKKADGNPFFVEEVIRMLIDREAIVYQEDAWVAQQEITTNDIPDNLQGLLLARIDRLPAEARYTLLVASVIGRISL